MSEGKHAGHLVRLVRNRLGAHVVESGTAHADGDRFVVARERLLELVAFLRRDKDGDLSLLVDITAVDRGDAVEPRFEVHIQLRSARLGYRAHIVTHAAEDATIPSLTSLFPAAEALERELYEMLGVYPDGHPQLRPLMLYAGFAGHPLRKDYRADKQQPLVAMLDVDEKQPVIIEDAP